MAPGIEKHIRAAGMETGIWQLIHLSHLNLTLRCNPAAMLATRCAPDFPGAGEMMTKDINETDNLLPL
jgi:hypothetical protein